MVARREQSANPAREADCSPAWTTWWRKDEVFGAKKLAAALSTAAAAAATAVLALSAGPAQAAVFASSSPDASTLYGDALATTHSWSVHYASASTEAKKTEVESGDAGPASGSQTVSVGTGAISILVIGGITYVKGNVSGLETLVGLGSTQAGAAANQWIEFSTDNEAFAPVVAGVRSSDLAHELALKGPLSLGHQRTIDGTAVDAIEGTQKLGHSTDHVVLYVRAHGAHVPVEEDTVNAKGQHTATEHVAYSKWGEIVRPRAPQASVSIGPISAV
jgi:hypothetical protein